VIDGSALCRTDEDPVAEFGTGLLSTSVFAHADAGFRWRRSPGPLARSRYRAVRDDLRGSLKCLAAVDDARMALGERDGSCFTYLVAGRESMATRLLRAGPQTQLEHALHGLGRLLRTMHDDATSPAPTPFAPPPPLLRLGDWFSDRAPTPRAAYAGSALRRFLGPRRWETLLLWHRCLVEDEHPVVVHGAPGLGSLVIGDDGGADLLTGEDLGLAPRQFDLGWVLGELVELKWYLNGDSRSWQRLTEALFDGYGTDLGADWNRMATLRTAVHLHDYIAYVGWHDAEFARYARFLSFLIDM
jgi:hypothetical protein